MTVTLTKEGGGFRVALDSPHPHYPPVRTFANSRDARGAAGGMKLATGCAVVDLIDEG